MGQFIGHYCYTFNFKGLSNLGIKFKKIKILVLNTFLIFPIYAADNVSPTVNPPGGLAPAQCPQFISFGFDDNGYPDGINWAADFLKSKKNPAGNGNPATYDNTTLHASFFITTGFCTDSLMAGDGTEFRETDVIAAWKRLYTDGNDVGDHTHTHADELELNHSQAVWDWENNTCIDILVNKIGIPRANIVGFRTPFLMFTKESMQSEVDHGFLYDCSIEHFKDQVTDPYNPRYVWPYTLDKGQAPSSYVRDPSFKAAPGLWEMPVYEIMTDTTWNAVTGLDWNMWVSKHDNKAEFERCLKLTLDNRLAHNRAPFLIGMHSDYYSQYNTVANDPSQGATETWQNRRAAVEDFINYALSLNKDIRIVSYKDVLDWIRHPVALGSAVSTTANVRLKTDTRVGLRKTIDGTVHFNSSVAGKFTLKFYTMNGKYAVDKVEKEFAVGDNVLSIDKKLSPGVYSVKIAGPVNATMKIKL